MIKVRESFAGLPSKAYVAATVTVWLPTADKSAVAANVNSTVAPVATGLVVVVNSIVEGPPSTSKERAMKLPEGIVFDPVFCS